MKNLRTFIIAGIVVVYFLSACTSLKPGDAPLRYHFKEGMKYTFLTEADITMEMKLPLVSDVKMAEIKMNCGYSSGVDSIVDGNYHMTDMLNSMYYQLDFLGKTYTYNSENPEKSHNIPYGNFDSLIGTSIQYKISPQGNIPDSKQADVFSGDLITNFTHAKTILRVLRQSFIVLPEGPIAIGDSWTHAGILHFAGFPVSTEMTYTLAEVQKKRRVIRFESHVEFESTEPVTVEIEGVSNEYGFVLKGSQNGTVFLDKETNFPVYTEMYQEIQGSLIGQIFGMKFETGLYPVS